MPLLKNNNELKSQLFKVCYEDLVLSPKISTKTIARHIEMTYSGRVVVTVGISKSDPYRFVGVFYE